MKKHSALMRASGILLVLTLGTSCFVGGTFAKYVSRGEGSDTARVAKWGVEVAVTGGGFKTAYGKDDVNADFIGDYSVEGTGSESITFTWNTNDGEKSSKKNVSNVIAPGTKGDFGGIKITGQPEVAVKIDTTAYVDVKGWEVNNGEFYCPLKFTIGDTTINGLDYSSDTAGGASSFEAAIKTAIEKATSKQLPAGTDLSEVGKDVTYSWEWPFENGEGSVCSQSDELDTVLGNNALGEGGAEIPAVYITVTTTVTQID